MRKSFLTVPALACAFATAGLLLHVYTVLFKLEGGFLLFALGLFLMSCAPYLIALVLVRFTKVGAFAMGAAACCLIADLSMHYSVFIAPKGSTAALGLLFMPPANLFVVGPVGGLVTWLLIFVVIRRHAD